MLYILAERIFVSIGFIKVENQDKGCASEPKKMKKLKIFEKFNFLTPAPQISLAKCIFNYYSYLQ